MRAQRLGHPWQREDHHCRCRSRSLRTKPDEVAAAACIRRRVVSVVGRGDGGGGSREGYGVKRSARGRRWRRWRRWLTCRARRVSTTVSLARSPPYHPPHHPSTTVRQSLARSLSLSLTPSPLHRQTRTRARTPYRSPPPTGARGKRDDPSAELCSIRSVTVAARRHIHVYGIHNARHTHTTPPPPYELSARSKYYRRVGYNITLL